MQVVWNLQGRWVWERKKRENYSQGEESSSGPKGQWPCSAAVGAGPCQGLKLGARWSGAAFIMDVSKKKNPWSHLQPCSTIFPGIHQHIVCCSFLLAFDDPSDFWVFSDLRTFPKSPWCFTFIENFIFTSISKKWNSMSCMQ